MYNIITYNNGMYRTCIRYQFQNFPSTIQTILPTVRGIQVGTGSDSSICRNIGDKRLLHVAVTCTRAIIGFTLVQIV